MKIIVCDDNPDDLKNIVMELNACNPSSNIISFTKPEDVLECFGEGGLCDIAILDIMMPEMSGIELAKKLRANGFSGFIVFLTSVNDFAAQSYKVRAFSYLLKPIKTQEAKQLLEEIEKNMSDHDKCGFQIKRKSGIIFVRFAELVYVEVKNHNLYFNLANGETLSAYATLREYSDVLLAEPRMVQHHRSFIINMDYVSGFKGGFAILWDNTRISIPREFPDFRNKFLQWTYGRR